MNKRTINMVGRRIGRLTITAQAPSGKNRARWHYVCDCGREGIAVGGSLRYGKYVSCGCAKTERIANIARIHGKSGTRTHNIWRGMLKRCHTPTAPAYKNYGARGIFVCERWHVYAAFLEDMGECPDDYSIERIDVNSGYSPGNCKWIPRSHQARNTRKSRMETINGQTKPLHEWCREQGLRYSLVRDRIARLGWSPERAISEPPHHAR